MRSGSASLLNQSITCSLFRLTHFMLALTLSSACPTAAAAAPSCSARSSLNWSNWVESRGQTLVRLSSWAHSSVTGYLLVLKLG